ncbi:hypothetical protein Cgig2_010659 [Carnegiea gigantea]|uniref:Uncharacterized protein n=1 Tax=Carnegiea gigantea TaxID=171969 RepID=A0A9Q1JMH1_9CARY|nr:hypothetical protein Cgig2_010659 [Carnegiea gigantea]
MGEFVTRPFSQDRRGIALSLPPLPKDFQTLCPGFELAWLYKLPSTMSFRNYPRFGYLVTGSTKLDCAQRAIWGRMQEPVIRKRAWNTREMANYMRETFICHWRSALRPPRPLPEDFHALCPRFSLAEAEGAAAEFELPEIVQATFYTMLLNEAFELGVAHEYMAESMKSPLVGLRWSTFEVCLDCMDYVIRGAQLYRPANELEVEGARDGQEEGSGSVGPPAPSSDEE